jgi:hypothetical protein
MGKGYLKKCIPGGGGNKIEKQEGGREAIGLSSGGKWNFRMANGMRQIVLPHALPLSSSS